MAAAAAVMVVCAISAMCCIQLHCYIICTWSAFTRGMNGVCSANCKSTKRNCKAQSNCKAQMQSSTTAKAQAQVDYCVHFENQKNSSACEALINREVACHVAEELQLLQSLSLQTLWSTNSATYRQHSSIHDNLFHPGVWHGSWLHA